MQRVAWVRPLQLIQFADSIMIRCPVVFGDWRRKKKTRKEVV